MNIRFSCLFLYVLAVLAIAPLAVAVEPARLTVGVPAYVSHPDERQNSKGWNEGWFQNEGIFVDATWPVYSLRPETKLRAGATAGVFDNSIYRTSAFVGAVGEVETRATKNLALSLGTYAGAITGYEHAISPALAPYLGASYAVSEKMELGARGFWLPAKTIGGSMVADSDAYVAAVTISKQF